MSSVHHSAAIGFAAKAATYAAGRPEYPDAIVGWLHDTLHLAPGKIALDLGAGMGKFTPRLIATGADVIAVEPVDNMRRQLIAALPKVDARTGTAQAIPVADASIDVVACAQAFHWFATPAALAEIRRVLKPGGHLALIWNIRDETVPWVAALTRIMTPYEGDAPRFHSGDWRKVFPADGFTPLQKTVFPYGHSGPAETVIVDRMMSVSFIAALPENEQAKVRSSVRHLIAATPELAHATEITFPYKTSAFATTKIS